jgi:hypothetical protein
MNREIFGLLFLPGLLALFSIQKNVEINAYTSILLPPVPTTVDFYHHDSRAQIVPGRLEA